MEDEKKQEPLSRVRATTVWTQTILYKDRSVEFRRETEPRFNVPVIKDENGRWKFDRDNVEWVDPVLFDDYATELLDQFDNYLLGRTVNQLIEEAEAEAAAETEKNN